MQRGASWVLLALLFTALVAVPMGDAACPRPPKDCNTESPVEFHIDEADGITGPYEDEVEDQLSASSPDGYSLLSAHGGFQTGDSGGVLVRFDAVPGMRNYTFTYDADPDGVEWQDGNVLTIVDPEVGDVSVLPFIVSAAGGTSVEIGFVAVDNDGNEDSGTIMFDVEPNEVVTTGDSNVLWVTIIALVVFLTAVGVFSMLVPPKKP